MRAILIALAGLVTFAAPAAAQELNDAERAEIRDVIRAYLLEHPEVIEEAILELQRRNNEAEAAASREAIAAARDELLEDPLDFKVGPEDAPVQIVEFFDYNCSYCRRSAPWVKKLIEERGDQVRFVFKEAPIFAYDKEGSDFGARAALAAMDEGKYLDLHFALLDAEGVVTPADVERIAKDVGLDWRKLSKRMKADELQQQLVDNLDLGHRVGMTGTPTFIVNGEIIIGADFLGLEALIDQALETETAETGGGEVPAPDADLK
jgi:protein-disulfide isomerase